MSLGLLQQPDICTSCGRYQKFVSFHVRRLDEIVDIHLAFDHTHLRRISAFPQSMQWFEEKQMMRAVFGRPNHQPALRKRSCDGCILRGKGKDVRQSLKRDGPELTRWGKRQRREEIS